MPEPNGDNPISRAKRVSLAALGVLLVGIGALGVALPGLPTTPFLLLATWCFARSFPALERRLLRNRFFAPYMRFVDGEPLPRRIKVAAIVIVWLCVGLSSWWIMARELASVWVVILIALAACLGTVVIIRRGGGKSSAVPLPCEMNGCHGQTRLGEFARAERL